MLILKLRPTLWKAYFKGLAYLKCLVPFGQRTDEEESFMSSNSVLIIDDAAQYGLF